MDPRRYPSIVAAIAALTAQACGQASSNHDAPSDSSAAGKAGRSDDGTSGRGGSGGQVGIPVGGSDALPLPSCPDTDLPFRDQVVTSAIGEQRVFYSWTTDEQAAELRAGTELFSRSERAGQGRGLLFTELLAFGQAASTPEAKLADTLVNETFAKARFAWTNPWATLLGFPGESYGNQLLKIELEPEAWIATFDVNGLSVFDQKNQPVPIEIALETPQRIGAIFYRSIGEPGGACGTFMQGGVSFREFALGNIAMVKRWSLATTAIGERLKSDIVELHAFEQLLACVGDISGWSTHTSCAWTDGYPYNNARSFYDFSLALPSELYRPSAMNLEALIAALEASLPTGEPLDVVPVK
jgi:hypothetical protein